MSANGLKGAEAGKALGDDIASNTVLKEFDISLVASTVSSSAMRSFSRYSQLASATMGQYPRSLLATSRRSL
jgi:hypothetical protein